MQRRTTAPRISSKSLKVIPFWIACILFLGLSALFPEGASAAEETVELDPTWKFFGRFHFLVLHLPIGFFAAIVFLEFYALFKASPQLRKGIAVVHIGMVITAILSVAFGLILAEEGGYQEQALNLHKWTGIGVAGASIISWLCHLRMRSNSYSWKTGLAYRFTLILVAGILSIAGHYGGNLTHGSDFLTEHAPQMIKDMMPKWLHSGAPEETRQVNVKGATVFETKILPIFNEQCVKCHGPEKQKGEYRLDTYELAFEMGDNDDELPPVVPGKPLESNLVRLITLPPHDRDVMPPKGKGTLTPLEIMEIVHWIQDEKGPEKKVEKTEIVEPEKSETQNNQESNDQESQESKDEETKEVVTPVKSQDTNTAPKNGEIDFARDIQPILEKQCVWCHGPEKRKSRLRLHTLAETLKGGKEFGAAIVPGKPDESPLFNLVAINPANDDDEYLMPPIEDGGPLKKEEIQKIRKWIEEGAHWPEGVELEDKSEG